MWYWVGVVFVTFLVLFEVFRTEGLPTSAKMDDTVSLLLTTYRNAALSSFSDISPEPGPLPKDVVGAYIQKEIRMPKDYNVQIRCVKDDDPTISTDCMSYKSHIQMTTYKPINFDGPVEKKDFLKKMRERFQTNWNIGLWKMNGDIETFSGIRKRIPELSNNTRNTLPDDVVVIYDNITHIKCNLPKVPKLWKIGCKCPENTTSWGGSECYDYFWNEAHETIPADQILCETIIKALDDFSDNPLLLQNVASYGKGSTNAAYSPVPGAVMFYWLSDYNDQVTKTFDLVNELGYKFQISILNDGDDNTYRLSIQNNFSEPVCGLPVASSQYTAVIAYLDGSGNLRWEENGWGHLYTQAGMKSVIAAIKSIVAAYK